MYQIIDIWLHEHIYVPEYIDALKGYITQVEEQEQQKEQIDTIYPTTTNDNTKSIQDSDLYKLSFTLQKYENLTQHIKEMNEIIMNDYKTIQQALQSNLADYHTPAVLNCYTQIKDHLEILKQYKDIENDIINKFKLYEKKLKNDQPNDITPYIQQFQQLYDQKPLEIKVNDKLSKVSSILNKVSSSTIIDMNYQTDTEQIAQQKRIKIEQDLKEQQEISTLLASLSADTTLMDTSSDINVVDTHAQQSHELLGLPPGSGGVNKVGVGVLKKEEEEEEHSESSEEEEWIPIINGKYNK